MLTKRSAPRAAAAILVVVLCVLAALIWSDGRDPSHSPNVIEADSPRTANSSQSAIDPLTGTEILPSELDGIDIDDTSPPAQGPARRLFSPTTSDAHDSGAPGLADRYDELADRARGGDAEAAASLGTGLAACRMHRDSLRKHSQVALNPDFYPTETQRSAAEERAIEYIESSTGRSFEALCKGITPKQTNETMEWLELGGNGGSVSAGEMFVMANGDTKSLAAMATQPAELMQFRATASRYLQQSARACSQSGFVQLSRSYQTGLATEVDATRSLAYRLLASWSVGSDPSRSPSFAREMQNIPEGQRRQAIAMARRGFDAYCR